MSTSDAQGRELKATLEAEAARFAALYPRSTARFAEIIGRRVSHIAGRGEQPNLQERRVPVNERVLMFVADRDDLSEEELWRFAGQVAALLRGERNAEG
jgi:hypothetical protein